MRRVDRSSSRRPCRSRRRPSSVRRPAPSLVPRDRARTWAPRRSSARPAACRRRRSTKKRFGSRARGTTKRTGVFAACSKTRSTSSVTRSTLKPTATVSASAKPIEARVPSTGAVTSGATGRCTLAARREAGCTMPQPFGAGVVAGAGSAEAAGWSAFFGVSAGERPRNFATTNVASPTSVAMTRDAGERGFSATALASRRGFRLRARRRCRALERRARGRRSTKSCAVTSNGVEPSVSSKSSVSAGFGSGAALGARISMRPRFCGRTTAGRSSEGWALAGSGKGRSADRILRGGARRRVLAAGRSFQLLAQARGR